MNVLSWNFRGLGNPQTIQFVKELIAQKRPKFICVCVSKSLKQKVERLGQQLGFEGVFCVKAQGRGGGLGLLWKNGEEGNILSY